MSRRPPAQILSALRCHCYELTSLRPGGDHSDLAAWAGNLDGARVVGLGEATHGTREFCTMKHRVVEYLVERLGFTVFALEADQDGCRALDDAVRTRDGDVARALRAVGYWTWNTREMLALLTWIRDHNAAVADDQVVRVVGVDPSDDRRRSSASRDRAMADAVLDASGRTVYWAHNGHISARYVTGRVRAAGRHLRDELGAVYYALGLTFGRGSFQALRATRRGLRGPEAQTIGVPSTRSIEGILTALDNRDLLVDLRSAEADPALAAWAGRRQRMRSFGSVMYPLVTEQTASVVPAVDFDGLAFIQHTTCVELL